MGNQFMLRDGQVVEVRLVKRPDGCFEDLLSGMAISPEQFERAGLFTTRQAAFQARMAQVATPGYLSPYGTYSEKSR